MSKKIFSAPVVAAIVVMAIAAVLIYASVISSFFDKKAKEETAALTTGAVTSVTTAQSNRLGAYIESTSTEETANVPSDSGSDIIDMDFDTLFQPVEDKSDAEGLLGMVYRRDMDALTVTFDGVVFKPGLKVKDIIDVSYWYTIREFDILKPGEAGYLTLENEFWSSKDIKLNDEKDNHNGDIVLWVHNYSSEPAEMRDCVIYKYQISYLGCNDFSERPILDYMGYGFGAEGIAPVNDSCIGIDTDRGSCTRHIYGSVNQCCVMLDEDKNGLIGITVSYNELYGPDFDKRER